MVPSEIQWRWRAGSIFSLGFAFWYTYRVRALSKTPATKSEKGIDTEVVARTTSLIHVLRIMLRSQASPLGMLSFGSSVKRLSILLNSLQSSGATLPVRPKRGRLSSTGVDVTRGTSSWICLDVGGDPGGTGKSHGLPGVKGVSAPSHGRVLLGNPIEPPSHVGGVSLDGSGDPAPPTAVVPGRAGDEDASFRGLAEMVPVAGDGRGDKSQTEHVGIVRCFLGSGTRKT